jgi:VanZ family protein
MENEDSQKFKLTLQIPPIDIYKIGHFIMFAILSFATPLLATWEVIIGLCLFAFSSEVLQLFVAGRTPQSGDVLLDILGIGSGILLLYLKNKLSFFKPNR